MEPKGICKKCGKDMPFYFLSLLFPRRYKVVCAGVLINYVSCTKFTGNASATPRTKGILC